MFTRIRFLSGPEDQVNLTGFRGLIVNSKRRYEDIIGQKTFGFFHGYFRPLPVNGVLLNQCRWIPFAPDSLQRKLVAALVEDGPGEDRLQRDIIVKSPIP